MKRKECSKFNVLTQSSNREPMAREPDMALFKTASGFMEYGQFLADISEQRKPLERLSKGIVSFFFRYHIALPNAGVKSDDFAVPCDINVQS